ncbi:MAG: hypothetical protein IPK63_05220 [Candidatus Competibacteraceae bacterium]|nr:hypothetical protein [Candidatus Competibacteraceae bacterium]
MKRTLLSLIVPPAAVIRYGCASHTAAPIGVFWLSSLSCIGYGLINATSGSVALGVLLWLIAAAWARLVIRGVESDVLQREDSTQAKLAIPRADESDPFTQLRTSH